MLKLQLPDFEPLLESFVPEALQQDTETLQRGRFIVGFSLLGLTFSLIYSVFYLFIHHYWGALVIFFYGTGAAALPFLLRATGRLTLCSYLHLILITIILVIMASLEGGLRGDALAWLTGLPLVTLLFLGRRLALWWCLLCAAIILFYGLLDYAEVAIPHFYPASHHSLLTTIGLIGLGICLYLIGCIFESNRLRAQKQMSDALAQLSQLNKTLLQLNQEKTNFLGIIAHDLRNPLTVISGAAEILQMSPPLSAAQQQDCLKQISQQSARMNEFLNELLDLQQLEEGRRHFDPQVCNLFELASQTIEAHRTRAQTKQILLQCLLPKKAVLALADPKAVLQILDNLVSNAIKYSPPGKSVTVEISAQPKHAIISVCDHGPGISVQDQERLFQKFSKLSTQPTGGETSTGLGLFIVKQIAKNMKGDVRCQSQPGEGSTFSLLLPTWVS